MPLTYNNDACNRFVADMADNLDLEVEHYNGRSMWEGPAVRIGGRDNDLDFQDVVRATDVRLQYDQMGLGLIVYPIRSGKLVGEPA